MAIWTLLALFICTVALLAVVSFKQVRLLKENMLLSQVNGALSRQNQLLVCKVKEQQIQLTAHINNTEGVLKERNTVWQFYRDSALMSGSAQDIMMGEIKRLIGKLPGERLHPALAQVAGDYANQHVNNDALPSTRPS